jgi:large subunit ribosomal protein L4
MMQQGNRRAAIAHVKTRADVVGSTKKLFQQKHTGRARRGPGRSPVMRGGGKAFGPRSMANFERRMPKKMRHAAVRSCLSYQAKKGIVVALESFPDEIKTKTAFALLKKLPHDLGRPVLFVTAGAHKGIALSTRNIPNVKSVMASYLSPEDLMHARLVVFLQDAVEAARKTFAPTEKTEKAASAEGAAEEKTKPARKPAPKKKPAAKKPSTSAK